MTPPKWQREGVLSTIGGQDSEQRQEGSEDQNAQEKAEEDFFDGGDAGVGVGGLDGMSGSAGHWGGGGGLGGGGRGMGVAAGFAARRGISGDPSVARNLIDGGFLIAEVVWVELVVEAKGLVDLFQ